MTVPQTNSHAEDTSARIAAVAKRLREAREAMGLSIDEIMARTRQTREMLEILEGSRTSQEHNATILRMQAAIYARVLDLPADEITEAFRPAPETIRVKPEPTAPNLQQRAQAILAYLRKNLAVTAISIAGFVFISSTIIWLAWPRAPKVEPLPPSVLLAAERGQAGSLFARASLQKGGMRADEFTLRALSPAFLEVRGSDGTIYLSRIVKVGEIYYPRMQAAWTLTTRDAGAFELWQGSQRLGTLGEPGKAIYSYNVDGAFEQALKAAAPPAVAQAPSAPGQAPAPR